MSSSAAQTEASAYSIAEFCTRHRIGKTTYYELKNSGKGPLEMKIGSRVLISVEAAEAWRRRMEEETSSAL